MILKRLKKILMNRLKKFSLKRIFFITFCLFLFSGATVKTANAVYEYVMPYVVSRTGLWSALSLRNTGGGSTADVRLEGYNNQGHFEDQIDFSIPAGNQHTGALDDFDLKKGWLRILSDQPLAGVFFLGTSGHAGLLAAHNLIDFTSTHLYFPHVSQNSVWDTEVFICNPNTMTTEIVFIFVDHEGRRRKCRVAEIPPMGSVQYKLQNLLKGEEFNHGSLEIQSNSGIAAFAIMQNIKSGAMSYTVLRSLNFLRSSSF